MIKFKIIVIGRVYQQPCATIHSLLNVYAKISGEFMPYSMFVLNKTTAFAFTTPVDKPMTSVKLHAKNGNIDLFMVR